MNGKADAPLKQLASLSKSLNQASDQLSKQITEIESALNSFKLGVSVWVEVKRVPETYFPKDGPIHTLTRVEQLGYGKHNGKWGLLVRSFAEEFVDVDYPGEREATFLRDASRDARLAAIDKIPELLAALSETSARVTDEVLKKAASAKEITAALTRKAR